MMLKSRARKWAVLRVGAVLGSLGAVVGCGSSTDQQPATQPAVSTPAPPPAVPPAASVNAVMVALVDHAAHQLWNAERAAPKDDAGWREVEHHAIQLAAAGPALAAGGTGEKDAAWSGVPTWAGHLRRQTEAATAAITAARSKNADALVAANSRLVEACEACHQEFKPDLPTEGIVHPH